jgi:hypothetical protein
MRSRFLVVVILIGVGAMAALGMVTKLALDSNKDLQGVTKFKAMFLEAFAAEGIEEISYRRLQGNGGVVLQLVARPERLSSADDIHRRIAEYFVKEFSRQPGTLKLSYQTPSSFGCGGAETFLDREFRVREVQAQAEERQRRSELEKKVASRPGFQLVAIDKDGERLRVDVECPACSKDSAGLEDQLAGLAKDIAAHYRLPARSRLEVRLFAAIVVPAPLPGQERAAAGAAERQLLAEGIFDGRGARAPSLPSGAKQAK